jgi:hypothetical protein
MSDSNLDRQLGELPSPRSPTDLDDKILSYAKEHAPARRKWLQPAWATGLAAAAIAGVAVFVTVPQQQVPATLEAHKEVMAPVQTPAPAEAKMENRAMMKMSRRRPEASAGAMGGAMEMEEIASFDSAMDMEAPALAAAVPQTENDVQTVLLQCKEWVGSGEIEKAEALYRDLQARCSDCGLPETLSEALEKLGSEQN